MNARTFLKRLSSLQEKMGSVPLFVETDYGQETDIDQLAVELRSRKIDHVVVQLILVDDISDQPDVIPNDMPEYDDADIFDEE